MDIFLISQLMYIAHNTKEESTKRELDNLIITNLINYTNDDDYCANKEALCWFVDFKEDIIEELKNQESLGYLTREYCDISTVFGFVDEITSIYTSDELNFQLKWWFDLLWVYCNFSIIELKFLLDKIDMEMVE